MDFYADLTLALVVSVNEKLGINISTELFKSYPAMQKDSRKACSLQQGRPRIVLTGILDYDLHMNRLSSIQTPAAFSTKGR